eukprot:scaffold18019_cov118-Isochrysis_galbana.AAC.3
MQAVTGPGSIKGHPTSARVPNPVIEVRVDAVNFFTVALGDGQILEGESAISKILRTVPWAASVGGPPH